MDVFLNKFREGFKVAQQLLLIEQSVSYQTKLKENKVKIKDSRSGHDKKRTKELQC
jgi:hypothetical protein